jgi:general secretion pathway protein K
VIARTPPFGHNPPRKQRGVALLLAILLVAIGTVLAASIAYDSAMVARRGVAILAMDQSLMVATGAEALAAYALREDVNEGQEVDHPGEIWGKPYGPLEIVPGVVLTAFVEDMQGRFNLNSLLKADGQVDEAAVAHLQRLLEMLEIEPKWAGMIADWIDLDTETRPTDGGEDQLYSGQDPPYRTPNLLMVSTSELLALPGFGRERYLKLAPYVAALPANAKLNLCSASGEIIDALVPNYREFSTENSQLKTNRERGCAPTKEDIGSMLDGQLDPAEKAAVLERLDTKSSYFRLTSIVRIGTSEFALYSLLERENKLVRPIMRSFAKE